MKGMKTGQASSNKSSTQRNLMESIEIARVEERFKSESREEMNRIVHSILEKASSLHTGAPLHVEKVVYQYAELMEVRNASGKALLIVGFSMAPLLVWGGKTVVRSPETYYLTSKRRIAGKSIHDCDGSR